MSRLQHLRKALDPSFLSAEDKKRAEDSRALAKAFQSSMDGAVSPVRDALKAAQDALEAQITKVGDKPAPDLAGPLKQAQDALDKAVKGLGKAVSDQIKIMEASILAEIKAIPAPKDVVIPKSERVDLSPLLEAIKGIEVSPRVVMPKAEERKTSWTFDIVRNRTTGLIESIEAR